MKMVYCEIKVHTVFPFCSKVAKVLDLTQFQEDVRTAAQLDFYMAAYSYPLAHYCVCHYVINFSGCFQLFLALQHIITCVDHSCLRRPLD